MNIPFQQQIEDYLLGRLDESGRKALETRLKEDPQLQQELKIQQLLLDQIEAIGDRELREKLMEIKARRQVKKNERRRSRTIYSLLIAAAVFITLVSCYWLFFSKPDYQQLYATQFEAYSLPLDSRDSGSDAELAKFSRLYRSNEFTEALPLVERLLESSPNDSRLLLARGICQMESGQLENSLKSFNLLIANRDPLYEEQAHWYKALAFLKMENIEACQTVLQDIAGQPKAFYYEKAKNLLQKLK